MSSSSRDGAVTRVMKIINEKGLHARASAKFVQLVEKYEATVKVSRNDDSAGGDSIMGLMMLAAGIGTSITVSATGPEARQCIEALAALVASRFGEEE
jgi:phosphocarrier protein HPr